MRVGVRSCRERPSWYGHRPSGRGGGKGGGSMIACAFEADV